MRFLLQARKLPTKHILANTPLAATGTAATSKAFGQQCSPQCGCVLRFEAAFDDGGKGDIVTSATYHAKTVICTSTTRTTTPPAEHADIQNNARGRPLRNQQSQQQQSTTSSSRTLTPQLTLNSRNQQPMFTSCTCPSLHTLAQQVVAHLPTKSFQKDLRNQVEFTGMRSSLAFSHAVLRKHELNAQTQTHCLDLVEDALTSMIRQSMPPQARKQNAPTNFTAWLHQYHQPLLEQAEEEEFVERYGRALRRIRKPRHWVGKNESSTSMTVPSPRSISALAMMDFVQDNDDLVLDDDGDDDDNDDEEDYARRAAAASAMSRKHGFNTTDWESHVDELYKDEDQEASA
jgi:hypothetical protein